MQSTTSIRAHLQVCDDINVYVDDLYIFIRVANTTISLISKHGLRVLVLLVLAAFDLQI